MLKGFCNSYQATTKVFEYMVTVLVCYWMYLSKSWKISDHLMQVSVV